MWGQRLSRANTRSLSRRIRIVRPSTATTFRRSAVSSASEQTRTVARDPLPVAMMSLLSKEDIRSDQRTACAGGGLRTDGHRIQDSCRWQRGRRGVGRRMWLDAVPKLIEDLDRLLRAADGDEDTGRW